MYRNRIYKNLSNLPTYSKKIEILPKHWHLQSYLDVSLSQIRKNYAVHPCVKALWKLSCMMSVSELLL